MALELTRKALDEKNIKYDYAEEEGLGSLNFIHRGLSYHIWEYSDDEETKAIGVDTNLMHAGKSEDVEGDYEKTICGWIETYF